MSDPPVSSSEADSSPVVVFKFGGTTVGTAERFRTVIALLREAITSQRLVAIVSALSGVSRQLSDAMEAFTTQSEEGGDVVDELVDTLRARHMGQAEAVLNTARQNEYADLLEDRLHGLRECFAKVNRNGFAPAIRDAVLATGEQLSVPMVTLALRDAGLQAPHCDATRLVVTDDTYGEANVDQSATAEHVRAWYRELPSRSVPIVAGFIGATETGTTTTLGFEGSDYSAALFARILDARCVTRYTDVDGLYTEDPGSNEDAERLDRLSMEEAYAMTESGGLGMHPKTLRPLAEAGIPMQVRSILAPEQAGTCILPAGEETAALWPSP